MLDSSKDGAVQAVVVRAWGTAVSGKPVHPGRRVLEYSGLLTLGEVLAEAFKFVPQDGVRIGNFALGQDSSIPAWGWYITAWSPSAHNRCPASVSIDS